MADAGAGGKSGRWRRWTRRIWSLRRLSWREQLLVAEAVAALALARMLIVGFPFHAVARRLSGGKPARTGQGQTVACRVERVARAMPFRAQCLERALAATMLLRRRGMGSTLHLGTVRGGDTGFEAHAWVSVAGVIVLGGPVDRYVEIARY